MNDRRLARASAIMAAGSIVSRLTGVLRSVLLLWVIGNALNADLFEVANTIPNSMYFLVAGGIFNVVLVPQMVRAMVRDDDGGEAYIQRVMTLGFLVLIAASVLLVLAVPLLMRVLFQAELFTADLTPQRESARLLMMLCMPQVFFYGAFVLAGQILNAKEKFGPMMWAPILNNLVAITMLGTYAAVFGTATDPNGGFTTDQALLLGLGSTLGIALQGAVLIPYLRKAGYRFRPRYDFRGVGLGHTLRLGAWTLGYILVNQVAMIAIVRMASGATLEGAASGEAAIGVTVYNLGYLISQAPHGIITVSLTTAVIPTLSALAAAGDHSRLRREFGRTLRLVAFLIAPVAVVVGCLGPQIAAVLAGVGAASTNVGAIGATISAFSLGLVAFSLNYYALRGFYASEDTRTPFFLQLVVASTNVGLAFVLTRSAPPLEVPMRLALSFGVAALVGVTLSITVLSRRFGRIVGAAMVRFLVRLSLACALTAGVLLGTRALLDLAGTDVMSLPGGFLVLAVAGLAGAAVFWGAVNAMRIPEAKQINALVAQRGGAS